MRVLNKTGILTIVLISVLFIPFFHDFQARSASVSFSPSGISKTWTCSSGLTCDYQCNGNPYQKMWEGSAATKEYSYSFSASLGSGYTCTVKVKTCCFDDGETNEVSDVYINDNKIGTTQDECCPENCGLGGLQVMGNWFLKDGKPIYLSGVYDAYTLFIWENDKGFNWRNYLDDLAAYHINYLRVWLDIHSDPRGEWDAQFTNPRWPWKEVSTGKFDLTEFDEEFWNRLQTFLSYASSKNIIVEITIFNPWGSRANWDTSPWNPANNVQTYSVTKGDKLYTLENSEVTVLQEAFVDKVLSETSSFDNIFYEIANEGGGTSWTRHFINYIKDRSEKLIAVGENIRHNLDLKTEKNDVINFHGGGSIDIIHHHNTMLSYGNVKPTSYDEHYSANEGQPGNRETARNVIWAMFTGGGYSNYLDWSNWRGTGDYGTGRNSRPPTGILQDTKNLIDFVNSIEFWKMEPNDGLVTQSPGTAFTIANIGEEYVTYIFDKTSGNNVEITLPNGNYEVKWYNPKTGNFVKTEIIHVTGGRAALTPPSFSEDIVLYIKSKYQYLAGYYEEPDQPASETKASWTYDSYFNMLQAGGANVIRMAFWGCKNPFNNGLSPWKNNNINNGPNDNYYKLLDSRIKKANNKGITVILTLYTGKDWDSWSADECVTYVTGSLTQQKREATYDKIIQYFNHNGVIIEMNWEDSLHGKSWLHQQAKYFEDRGVPVIVTNWHYDDNGGVSGPSTYAGRHRQWDRATSQQYYNAGKPTFWTEIWFRYLNDGNKNIDDKMSRQEAREHIYSQALMFHQPVLFYYIKWSAKGYDNLPQAYINDIGYAIKLANMIPWEEMEPNDGLVSQTPGEAHTFAKIGEYYVTYIMGSSSGGDVVKINLASGNYKAKFYNPKTGNFYSNIQTVSGGGVRTIPTPAFSDDIILYVHTNT